MEDRDEDAAVVAGFARAGGEGTVGAGLQPAPLLPNRASRGIHTARRALYIGIYRLDAEVRFPLRSSRSSR